jgi:hypothetical protein
VHHRVAHVRLESLNDANITIENTVKFSVTTPMLELLLYSVKWERGVGFPVEEPAGTLTDCMVRAQQRQLRHCVLVWALRGIARARFLVACNR